MTYTYEYPRAALTVDCVVFGFDGDTEYFLNCQYEPSAKTQILGGCDTMQQTFTVSTA